MRRKLIYFALPMLLFALAWGLKYRSDHPPVTNTDLEFRALLSKPAKVTFTHSTYGQNGRANHRGSDLKNVQPFVDTLILAPNSSQQPPEDSRDIVSFHWKFTKPSQSGVTEATTFLYVRERWGTLRIERATGRQEYPLHPATVKRWMKMLGASPKIGPSLRNRGIY